MQEPPKVIVVLSLRLVPEGDGYRLEILSGDGLASPAQPREDDNVIAETHTTWAMALDQYVADELRRGRAERHIQQQETRVKHFFGFCGADSIDEPTQQDVREWLSHLSEAGIPRRGVCKPCGPKTLNNHQSGLSAFFGWCGRALELHRNPCDGITASRVTRQDERAFAPEEATAMFRAAAEDEAIGADPASRVRARRMRRDGGPAYRSHAYLLMMGTGMRIGTVAQIRWRHIELHREPARVVVPAALTKNREEYRVELPEHVRVYLENHKRSVCAEPDDLFCGPIHNNIIASDMEAAGVAERDDRGRAAKFHGFRRMAVTEALRAGMSPKAVQKFIGHKDIATTLKYADTNDPEVARVVRSLAGRVFRDLTVDRTAESRLESNDPEAHPKRRSD
jgi:integrase